MCQPYSGKKHVRGQLGREPTIMHEIGRLFAFAAGSHYTRHNIITMFDCPVVQNLFHNPVRVFLYSPRRRGWLSIPNIPVHQRVVSKSIVDSRHAGRSRQHVTNMSMQSSACTGVVWMCTAMLRARLKESSPGCPGMATMIEVARCALQRFMPSVYEWRLFIDKKLVWQELG